MNPEQNTIKTSVIYLSGAGLAPTIWDSVRAKVTTPGATPTYTRDTNTTLRSATQEVLEQAQKLDADRYVIVAHSLGGAMGVELARALGDKLAGLIAISATVPAPGKSYVDALPFPQKFIMPLLLKLAGTKPPAAAIRKGLCNDLTEQQATAIVDDFIAEPRSLYVDKTSPQQLPAAKYLYVRTLDDKELPSALQATMAKRLPEAKVAEIASGHLPMISNSDELATIINNFIAEL